MTQFPLGAGELESLTRDLDECHRASSPAAGRGTWSRRRLLASAGAAAVGTILLSSCVTDDATGPRPGDRQGRRQSTDMDVAAMAAGLELLAVATYQAGLDAAATGRFGRLPDAFATFARTSQSHHRDHAAAWNALLAAGGTDEVTGVDLTVKTAVVDPAFAKVTDVRGLAALALTLEDMAAATYLNAVQNLLAGTDALVVAASIQPVEMQHSTVLRLLLGDDPAVGRAFATTAGARDPDDQIG